MTKPLQKAIFPVAGMGTRFLPATKATPKEMLPIVDKPLIQYAVEEAIEAGFTEMIFITSTNKRPIEDHFDGNFELEYKLAQQEKKELLDTVQNILPKGISCAYVRQSEALGLGHAVLCAEPLVNDEPFAVILADDLINTQPKNCLKKMVEHFHSFQNSILAVETIPQDQTQRYGIVKPKAEVTDFFEIDGIVEKPKPENAPSNLAVVGRYLLTPQIFHYLKTVPRGAGGEYQLTDAIAALLKETPVAAMQIPSKRFDCGSKIGYLEATVAYALEHPQLKEAFKKVLEKFGK